MTTDRNGFDSELSSRQLAVVSVRSERDIRGVNQHSSKKTLPGPDIQLQFRSPPGARYVLPIAKAHID